MNHIRIKGSHAPVHARTEKKQMPVWGIVPAVIAVIVLLVGALAIAFTMRAAQSSESASAQGTDASAISNLAEQQDSAVSAEHEKAILAEGADTEAASSAKVPTAAQLPQVTYTDNVVAELQWNRMPGGCELISLDIVLKASGVPVDIDELVANHLDMNGDYASGYAGSPYDMGGGFPPGIVSAANGYLETIGSSLRAYDLSGISFDNLLQYVDRGYPVLVWSTMDLGKPLFSEYVDVATVDVVPWYDNEHCVVVYGATEDVVLVSDPLKGLIERDRGQFISIYEQCGCMAAIVCPQLLR